jgi:tape measure domain-containing protein
MATFGDESLSIVVRLKDEASAALKNIEGQISKFQSRIEPAADASRKFGLALGGAAAAVGAFGLTALKSAANMEQTQIAFETMLGSAAKAKEFYADLVKFAASTPFELKGLETASKQLLAYGFEQKEVLPNLKALGDIASGVGMDKLPNLILAFGQVKAATRLTGMELRQFTEAGVPLLAELAKIMKKPVSAIQEMVSAGEIGFPIVQQAMQNLTGEGGTFNNLMEKQAKSLGGMWSNLADAWEQFLRGQGAQLIEWAKQLVAVMIDIVQNHLPKWIAQVEVLIGWFAKHKEAILVVAGAITGMLMPAILAAIAGFVAWAVTMAPWAIGGALIGALVGGIIWLVKNWDDLIKRVKDLIDDSPVLTAVFYTVKEAVNAVWAAVQNYLWPALQSLWNTIKTELWPALQELWTSLQPFVPLFEMWLKVIGALVAGGLILMLNVLVDLITKAAQVLAVLTKIADFIVSQFTQTIKNITSDIMGVAGAFQAVVDWISKAIDKFNQWRSSGASLNPFSASFKLPGFEHGGLIDAPRGTSVPIIAHGQERIVPAGQSAGAGGGAGGLNVVINNPMFRNEDDEERLKRMLDTYFRPLLINYKIR